MLKVLRHNLEKWRQRIPHEEYGVLKAYVEMELSKLGNKADIIKTAGGIHAGTLAHETFHDIQGFLYDNYPHVMDTLHASQDEHKDVVLKWFSDKSNSEWTGPRDYKIEHFYPAAETKSPYGADLMVAAYYAAKNKLGREPSDSVFIPLGNTQWDFGRNELVPVRVRTPQPPLQPLIASVGGPFPSIAEARHGARRGSKEAGRVAATAGKV